MNRNKPAESILTDDPFRDLAYLERYHMEELDQQTREQLYLAYSKKIEEIECEMNFLRKQVRERDLRIQLYQFSDDKLDELKENLASHPNLDEIWQQFELAYKLATGKNLIRFEDLEQKKDEFQKKLNDIL